MNQDLVGSTYGRFCIKFLKAEWKVSDTSLAHWAFSLCKYMQLLTLPYFVFSLKWNLLIFHTFTGVKCPPSMCGLLDKNSRSKWEDDFVKKFVVPVVQVWF